MDSFTRTAGAETLPIMMDREALRVSFRTIARGILALKSTIITTTKGIRPSIDWTLISKSCNSMTKAIPYCTSMLTLSITNS